MPTPTNKPAAYLAIEMWGKSYLTPPEVIAKQQEHAAKDRAPLDAAYRHNNKWVCVSSMRPDDPMRKNYEKMLARGKTGVTAGNRKPKRAGDDLI
jgi:hypothetical protein